MDLELFECIATRRTAGWKRSEWRQMVYKIPVRGYGALMGGMLGDGMF